MKTRPKNLNFYLSSQFQDVSKSSPLANVILTVQFYLGDKCPHSRRWGELMRDHLHETSHGSSTQGHSQRARSLRRLISYHIFATASLVWPATLDRSLEIVCESIFSWEMAP